MIFNVISKTFIVCMLSLELLMLIVAVCLWCLWEGCNINCVQRVRCHVCWSRRFHIWTPDIVWSCPFSRGAHNRRLSMTEMFSTTEKYYRQKLPNLVVSPVSRNLHWRLCVNVINTTTRSLWVLQSMTCTFHMRVESDITRTLYRGAGRVKSVVWVALHVWKGLKCGLFL